MNAICQPMPEIEEVGRQSKAILEVLSGLTSLSASIFILEANSIALYFKLKKYLNLTDFSCFKEDSSHCEQCLSKIEGYHNQILESLKPQYDKSKKYKRFYFSNMMFRKIIPVIEDRLDTLQFSTDPELVDGLSNYITHVKNHPSNQSPLDWREKIQAL
jgi:hypothetical protein